MKWNKDKDSTVYTTEYWSKVLASAHYAGYARA